MDFRSLVGTCFRNKSQRGCENFVAHMSRIECCERKGFFVRKANGGQVLLATLLNAYSIPNCEDSCSEGWWERDAWAKIRIEIVFLQICVRQRLVPTGSSVSSGRPTAFAPRIACARRSREIPSRFAPRMGGDTRICASSTRRAAGTMCGTS